MKGLNCGCGKDCGKFPRVPAVTWKVGDKMVNTSTGCKGLVVAVNGGLVWIARVLHCDGAGADFLLLEKPNFQDVFKKERWEKK